MTKALGFIAHKEVVVYPWAKKPDVELLDPSGEFSTFYLDVTLPALHQEAIAHKENVFENARKLKAKEYPRKDASGRLLTESACVPFIGNSFYLAWVACARRDMISLEFARRKIQQPLSGRLMSFHPSVPIDRS